jgi:hypothetical protein
MLPSLRRLAERVDTLAAKRDRLDQDLAATWTERDKLSKDLVAAREERSRLMRGLENGRNCCRGARSRDGGSHATGNPGYVGLGWSA